MAIRRLTVENFRGIQHLELEPHPRMNVIIGGNGSGKTALLEAIACILPGADEWPGSTWPSANDHRRTPGGASHALRVSAQVPDVVEYRRTLDGNSAYHPPATRLGHYFPTERAAVRRPVPEGNPVSFLPAAELPNRFGEFLAWFGAKSVAEALEHTRSRSFDYRDPGLEAVRLAIRGMIPACEAIWYAGEDGGIRVRLAGEPDVGLDGLSDGYRAMLALTADLAHRTVVGNPHLGLSSEVVVLIDEVDLHLHPRWQQTVLGSLLSTFPNAQFFVTTHAAPIIASAEPDQVVVLERGPEGVTASRPVSTYGALPERILEDVMGLASARPPDVRARLDAYLGLVSGGKGEEPEALELRAWLDQRFLGHDPSLVRADLELRRQRIVAARG